MPGALRAALVPAALTAAIGACTPEASLPDLRAIYTRAAEAAGTEESRPLITVPGTLGTRLVDSRTGQVIWGGGSRGISADPDEPAELRLLALPIPEGDEPFSALRDGVEPDGLLEVATVEFLGIPVEIDVYGGTIETLQAGGFAREMRLRGPGGAGDGERLTEAPPAPPLTPAARAADPAPPDTAETMRAKFQQFNFDYDWRRDLIETAQALGRFVLARRDEVAAERGVPPEEVRFDMLAHSMGGMVARYFLMYGFAEPGPDGALPPITWAGAAYFDRVVFVAPPNAGSILALDNIVNGKSLGPLQPFYPPALQATYPSSYQLLPRARHNRLLHRGAPAGDLFDVRLWLRHGWGLADPAEAEVLAALMPEETDPARRRARAVGYLERLLARARTFHAMMDRWAPPPAHLEMFLVVGGGFETPATAEIGENGRVEITGVEEGDGVVLRASVLLDERMDGNFTTGLRTPLRFKTTLFLPDEHVELTKNPVFGDNLLFWLLEAPRSDLPLAKPGRSDLLSAGAKVRQVLETAIPLPLPGRGDQ